MTFENNFKKITLDLIEKINIKNKKDSIESNFSYEYESIKFEGYRKTFSYDYDTEYPFNILKINNKIENNITVEYLHIVPRKIFNELTVDYKDLITLISKLKHKQKREDTIEILKYLNDESFIACQPEVSEDCKFIQLKFQKDEFTIKINVKAIFYTTDGWDYPIGNTTSYFPTNNSQLIF